MFILRSYQVLTGGTAMVTNVGKSPASQDTKTRMDVISTPPLPPN